MTSQNIEIIRYLLEKGRAKELRDIMFGESEFTSPESELKLNGWEEKKAWRMAFAHVEFVSKYGNEKTLVKEDGKIYSAYPDEFNEWLNLGAPGIPWQDLFAYLEKNPIENQKLEL